MRRSLTFNGIRKVWLYLERGRQESPYAPINHTLIYASGMEGAHVASSETDVLYVSQPIGFKVEDEVHEQNLLDELKEWLITTNDAEIQFDNVPGKTYIGRVTASMNDYSRKGNLRSGTLVFLCKPYKYGPEQSKQFHSDVEIVENNGTADANSIFELEVLAPITFAMIQNQNNEYMMIGEIPTIDDTPFEREQLINRYTMSNLTGWTESTEIEGGAVAGHILTDGDTFRPGSYGSGTNWHGPALKTSLSETLTDFKIDAYVTLKAKTSPEIGRLEISLLGAGNQVVGKLALKEMRKGTNSTIGEARIGNITNGHYLINTPGVRDGVWNDFYGILRLQRIGTQIQAYIAKIDGGNHNTIWESEPFEDAEGLFQEPITQVQVHFGQNGTNTFVADIGIHEIRVFKINDPNANQIPIIADEGDLITFDHVVENILINGESRTDLLNFGAGYFKLVPGENQLVVLPEGAFGNKSVKWRPPYR